MQNQQASYVIKTYPNGRRTFKPEFIAGCVADIRSGKRTVHSVAHEFSLRDSVLYGWLKRSKQGKRPGALGNPKTNGASSSRSLLEIALSKGSPRIIAPTDDARILEEAALAAAHILGEVSNAGVRAALGKNGTNKFMFTTWYGHVLVGLVKIGSVK